MTDLREKIAIAMGESLFLYPFKWDYLTDRERTAFREVADAVLAIARPSIIEECAQELGSGLIRSDFPRDMETIVDGCARIRALAEKS